MTGMMGLIFGCIMLLLAALTLWLADKVKILRDENKRLLRLLEKERNRRNLPSDAEGVYNEDGTYGKT